MLPCSKVCIAEYTNNGLHTNTQVINLMELITLTTNQSLLLFVQC